MATLLVIIIFTAYIGLGIPDSLLGAAWPAIYPDLGVPVSYAGFISAIVSCGTIISSFMSARVIARLGTAMVTALSTALTAAALFGYSLSGSMVWLCLFALPLGLGAGSVDTALNNYVALNYKATHINFLHCFYGVGVAISPYLMSIALSDNNDWRGGYRMMACIQAALAVMMFASLPVWRKVGERKAEAPVETKVLGIAQVLRIPAARASVCMLIGSCAVESACLVWGSTFLVETKGVAADRAAELITLYFAGMALGRFTSGLLASKLSSLRLIILGEMLTLAAIIGSALAPNALIASIALFFIGFGNGAVFPNMTHLVPLHFGKEISQSVIGVLMGFCSVSFLTTPTVFGAIARRFGAKFFPAFLALAFTVAAVSTAVMIKRMRAQKEIKI